MRVVVGEDEALLREGLRALLSEAGFDVVATAADAGALLRQVELLRPDLVITDIRMPPGHNDDGLQAAIRIRAQACAPSVLVLSQYVQRQYALELIGSDPAGVGYLLKQRVADVERFCADATIVGTGGTVLDREVVEIMMSRAQGPRGNDTIDRLTPRQREVLALLAEGRSNAAIAGRLHISEKAVVQHISRTYQVLELLSSADDHRRVLAVLRYLNG